MKHVNKITAGKNLPQTALDTGSLLTIIGTIMTGVGSVLLGISPFFGGSKS